MRLYYYTAEQWGMKSLREKRLKIAEYTDLNDPFELRPFQQVDEKARSQLTKVVDALQTQRHGVLCFSESWQSTLMWAHYGDKHKGMCLGFEIEDNPRLTKIEYISELLPCPSLPCPIDVAEQMLETCLNVKYSGWEYEKERRLRASLEEMQDGIYYYRFGKDMQLREVIIGARSSLVVEDVAEAIGTLHDADVEIWTARPAHKTFSMCENRALPRTTISMCKLV